MYAYKGDILEFAGKYLFRNTRLYPQVILILSDVLKFAIKFFAHDHF